MVLLGARRFGLLLCLLLSLASPGWAQGVNPADTPATLKAKYVLNFALYTEWPTNAFTTPGTFVVGILGSDPCAEVLRAAPDLIHNRRLVVREFQGPQGTEQCQLLLVTAAKVGRLTEVRAYLKNASVLTVVDAGKTVRKEGMINLGIERRLDKATKEEREFYCWDVNQTAAVQASLKLRRPLLERARTIF